MLATRLVLVTRLLLQAVLLILTKFESFWQPYNFKYFRLWFSMNLPNGYKFPQSSAHATIVPHIHLYIPTYTHIYLKS